MRILSIISTVVALCCIQAHGQYFPKSSLDLRGDEFKSQWYSSQLRALKEPSLLALTKTSSSESYRFLWLRTFHHPIAVRLNVRPDGTSILTKKIASGAGGYRPGTLTEDNSRPLTREQTRKFLSCVDKVNFWTAPNPIEDQAGTDGSQWIIEAVKGKHYHVVDRWMPKNGVAFELGRLLAFELGKINIPKNEMY